MSIQTLFKVLPITSLVLLLLVSSCGGEKERKTWIEDLEQNQNNSNSSSTANNIPSLVGDWMQVKMEFASPFNGGNIANVDFENQVVWSFTEDSVQIFEYPQYQITHGPYSCKDNTVSFRQVNDGPEVVNVFEQIGDTIRFTNTQGPITNFIYFLPFEADDDLDMLKTNKVNWDYVFQEDWEFYNARQHPGFDTTTFTDFTPPSTLNKKSLFSSKFDVNGDMLTYQSESGDYELKFLELHEWLDTFYFSLEVINANESLNKALQYYRLGDVAQPFNVK